MQIQPESGDLESLRAELKNAQAREGATREILDLLIQSRNDQIPVFDAVLRNATRLCNAPIAGLFLANEAKTKYELSASRGAKPQFVDAFRKDPPDLDPERFAAARAMVGKQVVHVEDLSSPTLYGADSDHRIACTQIEGIRTALFVPLIWNEQSIGAVAVWRREVRSFQLDEIALLETFAAQAVIAIENVQQFRALEKSYANLTWALERQTATAQVLDIISQSRADLQPTLDAIAEISQRLCHADMAIVWKLADDRFEMAACTAHSSEFQRIATEIKPEIGSGSVAGRAVAAGETIHVANINADTHGVDQRLTDYYRPRSLLAVPLMSFERKAVGVIVLARRESHPYAPEQVALVETFAEQANVAIENVRQFKELEQLNLELEDRVKDQVREIERMGKLKRFLPAAVASTVMSSGSDKMLSSHRALLGVLFCDIRGFTAFCETAEPEETIEVLQTYHQELGNLINVHNAGVDLRMGDGIMVLFNDPVPCEEPAEEAVRLALAMRERMEELCKGWKRFGHRLGFGVGVSLGYATVGMVGFADRSDYTASGTAINLGSRLCEMAEDGEILLSARAAIAVEDCYPSVSAGQVKLKGIRDPVEVFRLAGGT